MSLERQVLLTKQEDGIPELPFYWAFSLSNGLCVYFPCFKCDFSLPWRFYPLDDGLSRWLISLRLFFILNRIMMQLLISRKTAIYIIIYFSLIFFVTCREELRRAAYAGMYVLLNPPNHLHLMISESVPTAIIIAGVFPCFNVDCIWSLQKVVSSALIGWVLNIVLVLCSGPL